MKDIWKESWEEVWVAVLPSRWVYSHINKHT